MPTLTAATTLPAAMVPSRSRAARRSPASNVTSNWIAAPPVAAANVGASGVMPTAWNMATEPEDAAAAPSALR